VTLALLALAVAVPDKLVVLTFDDAVKSHRTVVAPLLKELGFGATFFVTHRWMEDRENFLTWEEIGEIHRMGFEIGNHSWTHANFASPRSAARLAAELALVENELRRVGVPRPVSFAYSGNGFGPEAVGELEKLRYRFARRGMQPEIPYGKMEVGPAFDPQRYHQLLIPTTGDAYPGWSLDHFRRVVDQAREGRIAVVQFHGVPDAAHPWVHTPPERFREYMAYLKREGFRAVALRDVERYLPETPPPDPTVRLRHPPRAATAGSGQGADADYWQANRREHDGTGSASPGLRVRPFPGDRHPRLGFFEGAILPLRGTKASVFLPWDPASYVVVDLPEAIFSNLGLLFLAHTHIPTIWDAQNVWIENVDWERQGDNRLRSRWDLPNKVSFGVSVAAENGEVRMELWLRNGTPQALAGLRTQVCVMLGRAAGFRNPVFAGPVATVSDGRHSIRTEWERAGRTWGNTQVPCMHSDPVLPDCAPGETVRVRGRLWFQAEPPP
jgi:peptidoglycan/xylan/chitin deacetylase (PgdA/CDA1 family)